VLVFIVGSGRNGGTLLTELIAGHDDVGFVSNFDDQLSLLNMAGRWNGPLFRRSRPRNPGLTPYRDRRRLLERGRLHVRPSEGWEVLERQVSSIFPRPSRDLLASDLTPWLERRLKEFFERRIAAQRCSHFVHHLTGWPRTGFLQAAFPDARFIHVVRDGRAVANSWLQMRWWAGYRGPEHWHLGPLPDLYAAEWHESGRSFVMLAGLGWKLLMDAYVEARKLVNAERWLDVRLEDLLADPHAATKNVLEFLQLPWTPRYEARFARHQFRKQRSEAFRGELTAPQLAQLERCIADHLQRWGYPLTAAGGPISLP
jgi:hypothetical protein